VDTKFWAAKYFVLPSNKLDAIAKYLGIGTKIRTDYDLWRDITFRNDTEALAKMVKYNKHDVELLESVFERLRMYGPPHTHVGVLNDLPKWTCSRCGSKNVKRVGIKASTTGMVKHEMQCNDDKGYYMINNAAYKLFDKIVKPRRYHKR